jgi:hypothetical protein
MLSFGKQLEVLSQRGEIAPGDIINQILQFEEMVYAMRQAQKNYFKERNPEKKKGYLLESKRLESQVDHILEKIGYSSTPSLF